MPFFLSIAMTCIVSLVTTIMDVGLISHFMSEWLPAWGVSWIIAFPCLLVVLPVVRRLTAMVVETGLR